jgi:hypothetical protein
VTAAGVAVVAGGAGLVPVGGEPVVGPGEDAGPALESLVYVSTLACSVSSPCVAPGASVILVTNDARGRVSTSNKNSVMAK